MIEPIPWRTALLARDSRLADAIACLERSGLQIAMVVDGDGGLLGTLTDGDIRRGLLRGDDLASPIEGLVQRSPLVVNPELGLETVLKLMKANRIHQLPVVDGERRVVGLHVWDALTAPADRPNTMVIMAGGKGTRLRPHTENCPKPMLPVGDRPMLQHIIERAAADGFRHFVLAINYLGHMVEDHFGDGASLGVAIHYLREDQPLGTGGALALLNPRPEEAMIVTNGDVMADIRYSEVLDFHRRHGAAATMAVRTHEWQHPYGVVNTQGMEITGFEEKPVMRTRVNAGIYALEPAVLDHLDHGAHCDLPTLVERAMAAGRRAIIFPMHEPWLDVGRPADLKRARDLHG